MRRISNISSCSSSFLFTVETLSQPIPNSACDFVWSPQLTMLQFKNSSLNKATLTNTHTRLVHTQRKLLYHFSVVLTRTSLWCHYEKLFKYYNLKVLSLDFFLLEHPFSLNTKICSLTYIYVHVNMCLHIILYMQTNTQRLP